MTAASDDPHLSVVSHRTTKFTPENIRQIINLVDRGKTREEIAEIIGVTPGTLVATCSKLKISLRRPNLGLGTAARRARNSLIIESADQRLGNCAEPKRQHSCNEHSGLNLDKRTMDVAQTSVVPTHRDKQSATLALRMTFKGTARTVGLPFTDNMIGRLALEAEFRDVKLPELISQLLVSIMTRDLFQLVLEGPAKAETESA